ncbi:MAG: Mur ligase family protein [Lysobacterales bacterium]
MFLIKKLQYLSSNLRLDSPALELRFVGNQRDFNLPEDLELRVHQKLTELLAPQTLPASPPPDIGSGQEARRIVRLVGGTVRALLIAAGHEINQTHIIKDEHTDELCLIIDGDDQDSNFAATDVTIDVLHAVQPGLVSGETGEPTAQGLGEKLRKFLVEAKERAMCAETRAIIRVGKQMGIPVVSLNRPPYKNLKIERCIRANGCIQVGQGTTQRILDGTVFIDNAGPALELIWDEQARRASLEKNRVPVFSGLPSPNAHKGVLCVGDQLVHSFLRTGTGWSNIEETVHPTLLRLARSITRSLDTAAIFLEVVAEDLGATPGHSEGAVGVIDFDLAPKLHELFINNAEELDKAAEALLNWGRQGDRLLNVPSVLVTGTNGKTTTSYMIRQILRGAGLRTGLASSLGILIEDEMVMEGDLAGMEGHLNVLGSREIDVAVLETARGAVAKFGFAFDQVDVAVCTNVSEDHIGLDGIHTLEAMAKLKLAIIQRAKHAVVLNADDAFCAFMYSAVSTPRLGIASLRLSPAQVREKFPRAEVVCTVAVVNDSETIELHDGDEQILCIAVKDIAATLDGRARFNLENAMQALIAGHFMRVAPKELSQGLKAFMPGFDQLKGRLNIYQGQKYTVIMDYAHNEAGLARFVEFASQFEFAGKRILVGGVPGDRSEQQARKMMGIVHRFYAHFVLRPAGSKRNYSDIMQKPRICRDELIRLGIAKDKIHIANDPIEAISLGMDLCEQGDLLILHITSSMHAEAWGLVNDQADNPPAKTGVANNLPA